MKTETIRTAQPHGACVGAIVDFEDGGGLYDIVGVPDQCTLTVRPLGFWRTVRWRLERAWDWVRAAFGRKRLWNTLPAPVDEAPPTERG